MPEDQDARLRAVEISVGSLKDRVQDHEGDIHRFGPLVTEQALLRQMVERELKSIGGSLDRAHEGLRDLSQKLEVESRERQVGQQARKEELEAAVAERKEQMELAEKENRKLHSELQSRLKVAALSLFGVFITSGGAVIVAIVAARGGK